MKAHELESLILDYKIRFLCLGGVAGVYPIGKLTLGVVSGGGKQLVLSPDTFAFGYTESAQILRGLSEYPELKISLGKSEVFSEVNSDFDPFILPKEDGNFLILGHQPWNQDLELRFLISGCNTLAELLSTEVYHAHD